MIDVQEEKNIHLSNFARFEKELNAAGPPALQRLRRAALEEFSELGFPTPRDEDWKFTNVAPIAKIPFKLSTALDGRHLTAGDLGRVAPWVGEGIRLVFVNGHFAPALSSTRALPKGAHAGSLAAVLEQHPEQAEPHLGKHARFQGQAFTALNTAFVRDGAYLSVPKNVVVEEPIYLVFLSTVEGEGSVAHLRNLILAGANSQARVVETYLGLDEEVYFTNAVTEVALDDSAILDHHKLQRESTEAFHVATMQVHQARSSTLRSHYIGLGGALVRNESRVRLDDEGCECTLNGLYLAAGRQHMDNHTVIDHARPHCSSHELYKGILDGQAHGVFNGKIFVRPDAQKTDAKQTNQTLLLSQDAIINTKPQLEIFADDVKCTHGATVGQLDAEAIFYLRTRGIDLEQARNLLTFAFANDIIDRIQVEPLRAQLEGLLRATQHLPRGETVKEAP
jgi:Fe-S cluster assembly protein SufD